MPQYTVDQMKKWSGENANKRFKYKLPTIKFNGNTGKFSLLGLANEDGTYPDVDELADTHKLVIMRVRRSFSSFEKGSKIGAIIKPSIRQYSNEFNDRNDHITIWKSSKGEKTEVAAQGTSDEVRLKLPELKFENFVYVLTEDGKTMKMKIKGASRHPFYEYSKDLRTKNKEIFSVYTQINPVKEEIEGGNSYYRLEFKQAEDSDLAKVGPALKDVAENLDKVDESYAESFGNKALPTKTVPAEEIPTILVDDELPPQEIKPEPEVKVEDIPF